MNLGQHIGNNADKFTDVTIAVSKGVTYGGAGTTGISAVATQAQIVTGAGLGVVEACAILGGVVAILGWLTNVYFQHRRDKRDEAHKAQLLEIERLKIGVISE